MQLILQTSKRGRRLIDQLDATEMKKYQNKLLEHRQEYTTKVV